MNEYQTEARPGGPLRRDIPRLGRVLEEQWKKLRHDASLNELEREDDHFKEYKYKCYK